MTYDIFPSTCELKNIVKQYVVLHSLEEIDKLLFLPNGNNFIVFNRGIKAYIQNNDGAEVVEVPLSYSISEKFNKVRQLVLDDENIQGVYFPIILVELYPIGFYKLFNIDAESLIANFLKIPKQIIMSYFNDIYTHDSIEDEMQYLDNALLALYDSKNNTRLPIEDVLDKIVNAYRYEITVESLVEEFDCSRSTMERCFKKNIGMTPKNYIYISKFCKTAMSYIEDECSFKDMEYLYSDNSHMNAVFKKFFGMSPSVILQEVKNKKIRIFQMHRLNKKLYS